MSDFRINIRGRNDHNTIIEKEYPRSEGTSIRLKSEGGSRASKNVRIVFEPSAVKPLFENITWGSSYRRGNVEQAGILLGNYYCDHTSQDEVVWADVVTVVPADPSLVRASFETIDITAAAWKKMYEDAAEFLAENLQIVGWYHTHLDNINTRFSGVDRSTQRRAFTYEYSFGVVFNPNQEKWSAFYGPDSCECVGELLFDEELAARFGKPQITINRVNGDSELREDGLITHFNGNDQSVEVRLADGGVWDLEEDSELSLSQIFKQFIKDIGLFFKSKKQGSYRNRMQITSRASQMPLEENRTVYPMQSVQHLPESQSSAPRIEIKNSGQAEPTIKCIFCCRPPAGDLDLVEYPDLNCVVTDSAIEEIMRCGQYGMDSIPKDMCLWSYVRQSHSGIELLSSPSEEEANARVIFIKHRTSDREKLVVAGIHESRSENIKFVVLVEENGPQYIVIRVVQL